jgi:hypothetical protein
MLLGLNIVKLLAENTGILVDAHIADLRLGSTHATRNHYFTLYHPPMISREIDYTFSFAFCGIFVCIHTCILKVDFGKTNNRAVLPGVSAGPDVHQGDRVRAVLLELAQTGS